MNARRSLNCWICKWLSVVTDCFRCKAGQGTSDDCIDIHAGYIYIVYSRKTGMETFCSCKQPEHFQRIMRRRHGSYYNLTSSHFADVERRYAQFSNLCTVVGLLPTDALYQLDKIDIFESYQYI